MLTITGTFKRNDDLTDDLLQDMAPIPMRDSVVTGVYSHVNILRIPFEGNAADLAAVLKERDLEDLVGSGDLFPLEGDAGNAKASVIDTLRSHSRETHRIVVDIKTEMILMSLAAALVTEAGADKVEMSETMTAFDYANLTFLNSEEFPYVGIVPTLVDGHLYYPFAHGIPDEVPE